MATNEVINEVIKGKSEGINEGINGGIKLTENEIIVLQAIKNNPSATNTELEKSTSISSRTIDRIIKSLREKSLIIRQGSNKIGYWQIIKMAE